MILSLGGTERQRFHNEPPFLDHIREMAWE